MTQSNEPMPLKDLPSYIKSAREEGQGDYVPVVEIGQIIIPKPSINWFKMSAYAAVVCVLIASFGLYASTSEVVVSIDNPQEIANIFAENGGRVFSVKREEDGVYRVRVFAIKRINSLVEGLRKNKELKKVELE